MPLIRKVLEVGNSRAVTSPKTWLDFYEKESGVKITHVCLETDGPKIILYPYFKKSKL